MEDLKEKPKELIINGQLYAHYLIERGVLYIKTRKELISKNERENEDFLIRLISLIEKRKLPYAAYLNIK